MHRITPAAWMSINCGVMNQNLKMNTVFDEILTKNLMAKCGDF